MTVEIAGHDGAEDTVATVDTFLVDSGTTKNWLFVKIVTSEGVVGWGECYTAPEREPAIADVVSKLSAHLVGRSVHEIRAFLLMAYRDFATLRGSLEFYSALSGLELALWDVVGKRLGQPLYNLLGGPLRRKLRIYANGWCYRADGDLEDTPRLVERASALTARGYTALKLDPFGGRWRAHPSKRDISEAVTRVAALREALGPDVEILIDCRRRFEPTVASNIARLLEPFEPFWLEEPVSSSYLAGLAEVRGASPVPVVTGEDLYTLSSFREVFERRTANIVNPDVACCGGLLGLTSIATMADTYMVSVAPHCYNSMSVAFAATLHASAVMPSFLITEYFVNFEERSANLTSSSSVTVDGAHAHLGPAPGHGVELDEEMIRHAAGAPVRRTFPMGV